jgi:hypothetical protein
MTMLRALAGSALALSLAHPGYATTVTFDDDFDIRFTDLVRGDVTYSVDPDDSGVYGAGSYQLFDGFELVSGTALELDPGTRLTVAFASALESVQLDVADAGLDSIDDVATVRVYGAGDAELIWDEILLPPFSGNAYERRYGYFGGGATRITIEYGDDFSFSPLAIDNLTYVVPEPSTYATMLAGIGLLVWIGLRRRAAHASN